MKLEDLVGRILEEVKAGKTVILEAYPGFGKTRTAALLLSQVNRGLVIVRTHNEIEEIFRFLPTTKGVIYAYGKPKLCFKFSNFSYKLCRSMIVLGRCRLDFNNKDIAWLAATFRKPEEIRDREKKHNKCLYRALRMLAHKSKKVVATYDYVVSNPTVMDNREVIVFDEAHNIMNYVEEVVVEINSIFIDYLTKELKKNLETRPLAYALRSIFRKSKNIADFIDRLTSLLSQVNVDGELVNLLDKIVNAYYNKRYYVANGSYYFLTDTLPKIAKVEKKIFIGAFLPPIFFYSSKNRERIKIEGEPRIQAYIDTSVTTKYTERDENLYKELGKKITEYIRDDSGNFIVFTSYEMMNNVLTYLPTAITRRIISNDLREVPKGGILVDVAGGKLSEGVNIRGLRNVIVVGMPYPEPTPTFNLLSKVFGFENIYTYTALLRTFQAIGRVRTDGTAYLLDKRFSKHTDSFPSWIRVVGNV